MAALLAVLAAALVAAMAAGCGGTSAEPGGGQANLAAQNAGGAVEAGQLAAALPSPASLARSALTIESGLDAKGSSFRQDLPSLNVTVDGDDALYEPSGTSGTNPLYENSAFAIYSFDLSVFGFNPEEVVAAGAMVSPGGNVHVFIGLPNYERNCWEWTEAERTTSFSWGVHNAGSGNPPKSGRTWQPVALLVVGDSAVRIHAIHNGPSTVGYAAGPAVFRKGWDGLIYGNHKRGSSDSLVGDGAGGLHYSYYDNSNGQLYYMRLNNRLWTTQAVDCDADVGSSNDLVLSSTGSLLLPYYDGKNGQGALRVLTPDNMASLVWSPRSNFDTGDDGSGLPPANVGQRCRVLEDEMGTVHVYYEDVTSGRIKHASRMAGALVWETEFVSAPGMVATHPTPVRCASGVCCAYISSSSGTPGADSMLVLAQKEAGGWIEDVLANDVHSPGSDADNAGFCDGSVRPGTDVAVIAYSSTAGLSVIHRDVAARNTLLAEVANAKPDSGAFVRLAMMGDGSVRLAHYIPAEKTVYFETGDIPSQEGFTSLPAVQLGVDNKDDDCDGIAFWVDPDSDGDGFHDAALVVSSSYLQPATNSQRHTKTGHVTLLK